MKIKVKIIPRKKFRLAVLSIILLALLVGLLIELKYHDRLFGYADVAVQKVISTANIKTNNYDLFTPPLLSEPETYADRVQWVYKRDIHVLSSHYYLIQPNSEVTPAKIREANPNAKIYRYYALEMKNTYDGDWGKLNPTQAELDYRQSPLLWKDIEANDWWLYDDQNEIIKEIEDSWLLDVGKPGFKEAFFEDIKNNLAGFDGVMFDVWNSPSIWIQKGRKYRDYAGATIAEQDQNWYLNSWKPFIEYVMDGLHSNGIKIIGNVVGMYGTTDEKDIFQRAHVDGAIYESFAIDWRGEWLDEKEWFRPNEVGKRIEALNKDPLEVGVTDVGIHWKFMTPEQISGSSKVSLAMYYLGLPQDLVLREKRSYNYRNEGKPFWDPLWDFNIGEPAGEITKVADKYFWSRKYSNGLVLLNYGSAEPVTYTFDSEYVDFGGNRYSGSVTMANHTALILQALPSPSSSPSSDSSPTSQDSQDPNSSTDNNSSFNNAVPQEDSNSPSNVSSVPSPGISPSQTAPAVLRRPSESPASEPSYSSAGTDENKPLLKKITLPIKILLGILIVILIGDIGLYLNNRRKSKR